MYENNNRTDSKQNVDRPREPWVFLIHGCPLWLKEGEVQEPTERDYEDY